MFDSLEQLSASSLVGKNLNKCWNFLLSLFNQLIGKLDCVLFLADFTSYLTEINKYLATSLMNFAWFWHSWSMALLIWLLFCTLYISERVLSMRATTSYWQFWIFVIPGSLWWMHLIPDYWFLHLRIIISISLKWRYTFLEMRLKLHAFFLEVV
jgi:hypothetical protein